MADALSLSSTFAGQVRSVNEKGLKLEGHDSWFNVSKYAVGVVMPERGQSVSVTVDKAGFIRSVTVLDGVAPVAGGSGMTTPTAAAPTAKDRTITRLAVLKAAAEFAAGRDLKSGDVLTIAASWERWVNRPADEPEPEDAF